MESYSRVGMQELDQRLSKIVEAARKKPVSVYRYGAPWVWIVSQEDWQGAPSEVSSYIPPGHSLALLKPQIESLLGEEAKVLLALAREHGMQLAPEPLIHALLLQLLYAIPSEQQLYEQLNYNLLYRWFVGLEMKQKIWSFPVFVGDITVLLNSAEAVRIIGRIIGEVISGDLMQMPEFSLNFALLHTWQARHGGARRLNI